MAFLLALSALVFFFAAFGVSYNKHISYDYETLAYTVSGMVAWGFFIALFFTACMFFTVFF